MNVYKVKLSWRAHMGKTGRTEREVSVDAHNRDQALLFAGIKLAQEGVFPYKPSVVIDSVTRRRIP